ncbi:MAG TPA: SRPBCC domain-containing protein, partial [Polyangiaceae bacterium]|nr:SRPBCC domain-containing protein [Polyangiaceae bacterium]
TLSTEAGGAFACFGDRIVGRNIELVPNKRIVQAWRPASWPEGVYSIARFELSSEGEQTLLVFEQDGVPEDSREHIDTGWPRMYWEPLRKYLEG